MKVLYRGTKRIIRKWNAEPYSSLNQLPIYCFNMVLQTDDLRYLLRLKHYENIDQLPTKGLEKVWDKLDADYIKQIGISDRYRKILNLRSDIAILKADSVITGNPSLLKTFARIKELQLEDLLSFEKTTSFSEDVALLEKFVGVGIDPMKTSVVQFAAYGKLLDKHNKEITRRNVGKIRK